MDKLLSLRAMDNLNKSLQASLLSVSSQHLRLDNNGAYKLQPLLKHLLSEHSLHQLLVEYSDSLKLLPHREDFLASQRPSNQLPLALSDNLSSLHLQLDYLASLNLNQLVSSLVHPLLFKQHLVGSSVNLRLSLRQGYSEPHLLGLCNLRLQVFSGSLNSRHLLQVACLVPNPLLLLREESLVSPHLSSSLDSDLDSHSLQLVFLASLSNKHPLLEVYLALSPQLPVVFLVHLHQLLLRLVVSLVNNRLLLRLEYSVLLPKPALLDYSDNPNQ